MAIELHEAAELAGYVVVVGGDLVWDPEGEDASFFLLEGAGEGVRAVAHFRGGGEDEFAGLLGNMGVAGEGEGDELS